MAAGGGTVFLMEGTHDLSGTSLIIDDGDGSKTLRIIGMGVASIVDVGGNVNAFDISGEQIGHLTLKDFKIDCNDFTGSVFAIHIDESNDNPIIIDNVTINGDGVNGWGVHINSQNVEVKNCRITNLAIGIIANTLDGSYANIHDNWIQGMATGGIIIKNESDYPTIKDNHIEDCGTGINCEGQYFLIEGNRIIDVATTAIWVDQDGHGSIIDNIIYDLVDYGIYLNCDHVTVTSNNIEFGHTNSGSNIYGIYPESGTDFIAMVGNVITNIKNTGAGIGYGIHSESAEDTNSMIGNSISDCDLTFKGGFSFLQGDWIVLQNNTEGLTLALAGGYAITNDGAIVNLIDTVANGAYIRILDKVGSYTKILASEFVISSTKVK